MLIMPPPRHTAASRCRRPPRRQWQRRQRQALCRRFRSATLTAATLVAGAACCCPRHHHSSIAAAAHALSRTPLLAVCPFLPVPSLPLASPPSPSPPLCYFPPRQPPRRCHGILRLPFRWNERSGVSCCAGATATLTALSITTAWGHETRSIRGPWWSSMT